jgi:mevalonate kinase
MNKVTVSAPGKLMLLGEHAVVYNHPCLVTAVDQRMWATVEVISEPVFELQAPDAQVKDYKKPISEVGRGDISKGAKFVEIAVTNILSHPELVSGSRAKARFRNKFGMTKRQVQNDNLGIRITTKSEFSTRYGFGSSSASILCTIKAISELFNLGLSKKELFDISYKTVLDIQGKGSGFDVAAAVYGGTLYFVTGGRVIEPLNIKSLPLVVGYSGVKADTVNLINKVKESFVNRQDKLNAIFNGIENLVNQGKEALIKMNWQTLGNLMNKNQDLLKELGVSIEKLDNMIKAALNAGAYGGKISGAGGGDCMIATTTENKKLAVEEAIIHAGGKVINVETNAEGVRVE